MTRVGIVGCGITGLALTHYLAREGAESVAFEAAEGPGGVIRSTREGEAVLEHGPQRLRLTEPVAELVGAVGLEDAVIEGDDSLPLYVYADGKLRRVPFSIRELLATDLLSWRGKLRLFMEPLTAPGRGDETAAELISRKFGREAYENFVGPLFGGIYGSDPAEMPARHALSGLLRLEERRGNLLRAGLERARSGERPPPASFEEGMQQLPAALAERHADRIELGTPVEGIERDGEGFRIVAAGREAGVDRVVVTTRANVTADLLSGIVPGASRLADLTYNPLAIVHLRADAGVEGFGYQIRDGEGFRTLGVSWNASLLDRDGVYTCFLGGMRDPGVVDLPPAEIGETAAVEFEEVVGATAEVANVTRLERAFPAYDRSWDVLDEVDVPDGIHLATNYTARLGVPSRIREARGLAGEFTG